ncbi:EGF-like domain protein [Dictyocaulus viviparus]|uniref:EGF-like domain protein n=1 Tax=Dictyocaulus viviparus TaxID=29172 RepID=A0A0D8XMB2_DICVI|nr:EGF-like domain protein [Dictyocaulus viviparus]
MYAVKLRTCPAGIYGPNCVYECACQNGAECNAKDGSCICAEGFYGASCNEVCPAGRYGKDCMNLCGCQNGAICSPVDGKCECRQGWMGENCEKPCEQGYFGKGLLRNIQDCLQRCDCANGMHCDPSDGECICPLGKRGPKCDQECENGRFGAGCRGICTCENGAICDSVSGAYAIVLARTDGMAVNADLFVTVSQQMTHPCTLLLLLDVIILLAIVGVRLAGWDQIVQHHALQEEARAKLYFYIIVDREDLLYIVVTIDNKGPLSIIEDELNKLESAF